MGSNKERYAALQAAVMEQNFEKIRGFIADDFVIGFKSKRIGKNPIDLYLGTA